MTHTFLDERDRAEIDKKLVQKAIPLLEKQ